MPIKQQSTSTDIIESGSIFTYRSEPLVLEFNDKLIVHIKFANDSEKGKKIETKPMDNGKYLEITLYNAKGIGATTEPLFIAEDDKTNKKLYLSLAFQEFTGSFLCSYTIFREK